MHADQATVQLGSGGPAIRPLGVGTVQWGDRLVWGFGREFDAEDAQAAFWEGLRAGITLVDTAEIYGTGRSERLIGEFLKSVRTPVQVATKFFPMPWRLTESAFLRALRGSLRRLRVDRVALYQVHWPTPLLSIDRLMDWMSEAVGLGLVEQVGVSNFGVEQTKHAVEALDRHALHLASNQVHFNLLARDPLDSGLLEVCRSLGVSVVAYSPLEQGLLSGKYSPENPPPGVRGIQGRRKLRRSEPLLETLRELGRRHDRTTAQVALRWTIEHGTIPIPGAKNARQAAENAAALDFSLSADDVALLDRVASFT